MIKRFVLPDVTPTTEQFVDAVCRYSFNRIQYLGQSEDIAFRVAQGFENHVHMVGHDHDNVHKELLLVIMKTGPQNNFPCLHSLKNPFSCKPISRN